MKIQTLMDAFEEQAKRVDGHDTAMSLGHNPFFVEKKQALIDYVTKLLEQARGESNPSSIWYQGILLELTYFNARMNLEALKKL